MRLNSLSKNLLFSFSRKKKTKALPVVQQFDLESTYKMLKSFEIYRFKQAFNINVKLSTDPKKSEQNVRGVCVLPKGLGKEIRVCFYAKDEESISLAQKAGVDLIANQ